MQSLIGTWSLPRATPIEYADVGVCVCEWYMYVDIQLQWGIPCNVKRLCAHMVSLCGLCCLCSYRRKNVCLNNVLTPLWVSTSYWRCMGLLPDTQNCGLRMRRECRERFPCHWLQRKPLVSDPGMHHSTCVTHVPRCMSGSLTGGGGENVPGIPGACATRNFAYLVRGPWLLLVIPYKPTANFDPAKRALSAMRKHNG